LHSTYTTFCRVRITAIRTFFGSKLLPKLLPASGRRPRLEQLLGKLQLNRGEVHDPRTRTRYAEGGGYYRISCGYFEVRGILRYETSKTGTQGVIMPHDIKNLILGLGGVGFIFLVVIDRQPDLASGLGLEALITWPMWVRYGMYVGVMALVCLIPTADGEFEDSYQKGAYKDGELDGPYEGVWENGNLREKKIFRMGKEHGPYEEYFEKGGLNEKGTYKDGNKDGPYERYFEDGGIRLKGTFPYGPYEEYYPNGQLREKGSLDDHLDGPYERYFEDGGIREKGMYHQAVPYGPFEEYYPNGQLKEAGSQQGDERDGPFETYYANGQLDQKGSFKDNKLDGLFEQYSKDGRLEEKGIFNQGKQCGEWFENGKTNDYPPCPPGLEGGN